MSQVVLQSFFDRPTEHVARDLLGLVLVRRWRGREAASTITEVEAYDGFDDRASHAHKGKTARNAVMFGPPGNWYVYLCYGMHWMLNVVTREAGYPAAVLIRGVQDMQGPGRLTKHLHVTGTLSGISADDRSGLWIEDRDIDVSPLAIQTTPRIGVAYAGEWAAVPRRFVLKSYDPLARRM